MHSKNFKVNAMKPRGVGVGGLAVIFAGGKFKFK